MSEDVYTYAYLHGDVNQVDGIINAVLIAKSTASHLINPCLPIVYLHMR